MADSTKDDDSHQGHDDEEDSKMAHMDSDSLISLTDALRNKKQNDNAYLVLDECVAWMVKWDDKAQDDYDAAKEVSELMARLAVISGGLTGVGLAVKYLLYFWLYSTPVVLVNTTSIPPPTSGITWITVKSSITGVLYFAMLGYLAYSHKIFRCCSSKIRRRQSFAFAYGKSKKPHYRTFMAIVVACFSCGSVSQIVVVVCQNYFGIQVDVTIVTVTDIGVTVLLLICTLYMRSAVQAKDKWRVAKLGKVKEMVNKLDAVTQDTNYVKSLRKRKDSAGTKRTTQDEV
jgi:hypothetical protein